MILFIRTVATALTTGAAALVLALFLVLPAGADDGARGALVSDSDLLDLRHRALADEFPDFLHRALNPMTGHDFSGTRGVPAATSTSRSGTACFRFVEPLEERKNLSGTNGAGFIPGSGARCS